MADENAKMIDGGFFDKLRMSGVMAQNDR